MITEWAIKQGFCPVCGHDLQNTLVQWHHENGWCNQDIEKLWRLKNESVTGTN